MIAPERIPAHGLRESVEIRRSEVDELERRSGRELTHDVAEARKHATPLQLRAAAVET